MVVGIIAPRGAALSSFAAPSSAANHCKSSQVRVVARIRPLNNAEFGSQSCLYTADGDEVAHDMAAARLDTAAGSLPFRTPSKILYSSEQTQETVTPLVRNTSMNKATTALPPLSLSSTQIKARHGKNIDKDFDYDAVFSSQASQQDVYNGSIGDAVRRNIFRGYNTTIIAYGQSGSGKTHTMFGDAEATKMATSPQGSSFAETFDFSKQDDFSSIEGDGIIPRAIHDLFQAKRRHESAAEISISLTYLEIYNDELRDLLVDEHSIGDDATLRLRDAGEELGFCVSGLTSVLVTSEQQVRKVMDSASTKRRTCSTKLNMRSSRSHAICTLLVTINPAMNSKQTPTDILGSRGREIITAKLTMVDLAGSERIKLSGVTGQAQKESININKDLFVLAKVVSTLAEQEGASNKKSKKTHIPYRDSKLTRLLRDSLGGNCCTVLVACVSPSAKCFDESINTLRYAERTRSITNSIKQNVVKDVLSPTECAALRGENKMLKKRVAELNRLVQKFKGSASLSESASLDESDSFHERDIYMSKSGDTEDTLTSRESSISVGNKSLARSSVTLSSRSTGFEDELRAKGSLLDSPQSQTSQNDDKKAAPFLRLPLRGLTRNPGASDERLIRIDQKIAKRQRELEEVEQSTAISRNELNREVRILESKRDAVHHEIRIMEKRLDNLAAETTKSALDMPVGDGMAIEMVTFNKRSKIRHETTLQRETEANARRIHELETSEFNLKAKMELMKEKVCVAKRDLDQAGEEAQLLMSDLEKITKERDEVRVLAAVYKDDWKRADDRVSILQDEVHELRRELSQAETTLEAKHESSVIDNPGFNMDDSDTFATKDGADSIVSSPKDIRVHAAKMLFFANQQIERNRSGPGSVCSSLASSKGSEFKPDGRTIAAARAVVNKSRTNQSIMTPAGKPPRPSRPGVESPCIISNMEKVETEAKVCSCQKSLFSGNPTYVEFYLPKLGTACECGTQQNIAHNTHEGFDPYLLSNILRPWQVEFCASVNIHNAIELVHTYNQRGGELASAMRKWRKEFKCPAVKTKSCKVALHIWVKTCKMVVRSVRKQREEGATTIKRPEFLEVQSQDAKTVSTLGWGSVVNLQHEFRS